MPLAFVLTSPTMLYSVFISDGLTTLSEIDWLLSFHFNIQANLP